MRVRLLTWALARLLIVLPLWCLGLGLLVLGLALSPWGTGLLLSQGERLGLLEVGRVEGAPLDTLLIEDLRVSAGPARVAVARFELAWAEDCLLDGRLCLDRLVVEGARIRLAGSDAAPEEPPPEAAGDDPPGAIQLPFPIELRELALRDVEVTLADGTQLRWESFTTGAVAEAGTLRLDPTRLTGARLRLPLSPGQQLALSEAEQATPRLSAAAIDAAVAVRSPLPAQAAAVVEGRDSTPPEERPRLALPEITLPLAVEVPRLTVEDAALEGAMAYVIDRLELSVTARDQRIAIDPLAVATREADAELMARITLHGDYPLQARLAADFYLPERLPALAGQRLELVLAGSLADLEVDLTASGPVEAHFTARLDALDPDLPFAASLQSPELQWPLPGAPSADAPTSEGDGGEPPAPWRIEDLSLSAEGRLTDYRTRLALTAEGPSLPRSELSLTGSGNLEHFAWQPLRLATGEGIVSSQGRVDWSEALSVSARLGLDNVDPEPFVEGLSGRLDGEAELAFSQTADGWRLGVPSLALDGELADQPLALQARLSGDSGMHWWIDSLILRQGDNRLTADGEVAPERLALDAVLDLPRLGDLYPSLAGALSGRLHAAGSLEAPRLELALEGENLALGENRLTRLSLAGEVAGLEDPTLDLALTASEVAAGGQQLADINLNLDGRLSSHRLTLAVDGDPEGPLSRLALALEGGLGAERQRYRGRLSPLEAVTAYGGLALEEALTFEADLAAGAATVEPFCLVRVEGGALCLEETLSASAEQGRAVLTIRDLPMDLVAESLPAGWDIAGNNTGDIVASWSRGAARWQLDAALQSRAAIEGEDAYGQPWSVPGTGLELDLEANQARADLALALTLGDSGALRLDLEVDDPLGAGRLDGRLRVEDLRLSPYRPLVAGLETLEGGLDGEVGIGGTRTTPRLDGRVELAGLRAAGLDLPIAVTDGRVTVALAGERADIDGFLATEEGRLRITGDARWPSPEAWRAAIDLQARDEPLLATLPGFGRLRLAPDLSIRATPERLRVRGDVRIPWARLEVGQVPASAVSPSPDEVILTREQAQQLDQAAEQDAPGASTAEAMERAGMALDIRVDLQLGPDMRLTAYGLETALAGGLEVRQSTGPLQLFGDVNLEDGRFRAFGQDLIIREGILYFSGPPGEPLLDFEAIRNPASTEDDVVAGLRVTGPASSPSLAVFSEPAMDEARALSYVLRGRAPDDAGGADGALTSALIGVTLGRAGGAVGAIGEAFGIQDLSLDTAGTGEESQVVVTGNLTDRLSVGYGVGVFSPIAELTLRYKLWRDFYVEAVSGAAQAVDLIYTFSLPGDPPTP
ncbi:translocation/assembly module TamB domain-containing protein [Halomonas sp. M4R1S46]|uniref:autotransporter assembly complex protein TamB n=1 Tax=Halomonas sp. M4R1S46 TaxID=2982692 RepID=UPI0021E4093D|nr:translocation/assembly module TamB domain-containing protein [Halomonas sp. M4R1S46]UYG09521.1 translocation/assembly module TamB [Halomonas sp. M4R1S46]